MIVRGLHPLVWATSILAVGAHGQSQTVVQEKVAVIRALTGHADIGLTNVSAKGITVERCSSDWKTVLDSTTTDEKGYFSLKAPKNGRLLYVRFSAAGVNPYYVGVRIKKTGAPELRIHLAIAT